MQTDKIRELIKADRDRHGSYGALGKYVRLSGKTINGWVTSTRKPESRRLLQYILNIDKSDAEKREYFDAADIPNPIIVKAAKPAEEERGLLCFAEQPAERLDMTAYLERNLDALENLAALIADESDRDKRQALLNAFKMLKLSVLCRIFD